MAVMSAIDGLAWLSDAIAQAFGALETIAQVLAGICIALCAFAWGILELLCLISTGQIVPFVQRLAQMLSLQ
jgi:hypothetical protein